MPNLSRSNSGPPEKAQTLAPRCGLCKPSDEAEPRADERCDRVGYDDARGAPVRAVWKRPASTLGANINVTLRTMVSTPSKEMAMAAALFQ